MGSGPGRTDDLQIQLSAGSDAAAEELAALTSKLRRELLELRVDEVRLADRGSAPPGARAAGALEVGAMTVALVRSPGLVSSIGQALSAWISSRNDRSAVVQLGDRRIELEGISHEDQLRLLELFELAPDRERP